MTPTIEKIITLYLPSCWCCRLLFHSAVLNVSQPGRLGRPPAALPVLWNVTRSSLTQFPRRASDVFVCADRQKSARYNTLPLFMDCQRWYSVGEKPEQKTLPICIYEFIGMTNLSPYAIDKPMLLMPAVKVFYCHSLTHSDVSGWWKNYKKS